MKSCPRCRAEYFDNQLEFCLDDGARLTAAGTATQDRSGLRHYAGVTQPLEGPLQNSTETVVLEKNQPPAPAYAAAPVNLAISTGLADTAALVLALLHNWWQWVYLEKVYISSITDFLLSANFLMWLLLLSAGTAVGIYSVKVSKNKTLAIISLITLAINLILFLVPRR